MSSVREVQCHIAPQGAVAGRCSIFLQTPLTISAETPSDGWVTYIKFNPGWVRPAVPVGRFIARVDRITTRTDKGPAGLRRRLKHLPWTQDSLRVWSDRAEVRSKTRWYRPANRRPGSRTKGGYIDETAILFARTARVSFDPAELYAFLAGVRDTGDGIPLLDWLVEKTEEFAPLISSAGWLPRDEAEMIAVRKQREAKQKALADAPIEFPDEDVDTDLDSWP